MQSLKESQALLSWKKQVAYEEFILTSLFRYSPKSIIRLADLFSQTMASGLQLLMEIAKACPASPRKRILSWTQVVSQNVLSEFELLLHEIKKTAVIAINKKFFIKK